GVRGALKGIFEADTDPRHLIFATRPETSPLATARTPLAEQRFEEVAEIAPAGKTAARAETVLLPPRWRPEILAFFPISAELIVSLALFRILQHFVGFVNFLETGFGIRLLADIWVIFARQPPIGALDVV